MSTDPGAADGIRTPVDAGAARRRPRGVRLSGRARGWDVVVTIAILLFVTSLAVEASTLGWLVGFAEDECAPGCVQPALDAGIGIAVVGPFVVAAALVVVAVVRMTRRRPAWWVPLVGVLALPVPIVVGGLVAYGLSGA